MIPTEQDVIDAFDSFEDSIVHSQALQSKLRNQGFDINEIVTAINGAIKNGKLANNSIGELSKV